MSSFEDFIDKLAPYPNDVNRLARLIRDLDKRLENVQSTLLAQQKKFESKLKQFKEKKQTQVPAQLKQEYQNIVAKQKQLYGYAKQKQAVSDQLQFVITSSYELVKNDLKNKIKDKPQQDQSLPATKKKKKPLENLLKTVVKQQQFLYDNANPKYCYCVGPSYGEMVCCENNYCEKQWFHSECVDDKTYINEAEWHCKDCKKLIEKFKKANNVREFI